MHARLEAFLFRLARDNVTPGVIEEQAAVVEQAHEVDGQISYQGVAAEHLGAWAKHMATRLVAGGKSSADPLIAEIRTIVNRPYAGELESPEEATEEEQQARRERQRRSDCAEHQRRLTEIRALLSR